MIHRTSPLKAEIEIGIAIETTQPTIPIPISISIPNDLGRFAPPFGNQDHPRAPAKTPWLRPRPSVCSGDESEGMRRAP
mgnify:CR=1 FL=1